MLAVLPQFLAQAGEVHKSAADEGRDIVLSMLVVGLATWWWFRSRDWL